MKGEGQSVERPTRRKWRWFWFVGVVCLAVVFWLVWARTQAEPLVEGKPLSHWLAGAGNTDDFEALARIGPEVIPDLVRVLDRRDSRLRDWWRRNRNKSPVWVRNKTSWPVPLPEARKQALVALKQFGPEARAFVPRIIETARHDPDVFCRIFALQALAVIGPEDPRVVDFFCELLRGGDTLASSGVELAIYGASMPSSRLANCMTLEYTNANNRALNTLLAFRSLGTNAVRFLPGIQECLRREDTKANALTGVRQLGPAAVALLPELANLLKDKNPEIRAEALTVVMNIGPTAAEVVPQTTALLDDEDATVRSLAAAALYELTGNVEPSLSVLEEILRTPGEVRGANWWCPVYLHGLEWHGLGGSRVAAWLIGELGLDAAPALPLLEEIVRTGNDRQAMPAARAVWRAGGEWESVAEGLRKGLESDHEPTRVLACVVLKEIGPPGAELIPDLEAAMRRGLWTWQAALAALEAIQASRNGDVESDEPAE